MTLPTLISAPRSMGPGSVLERKYRLECLLGEGGQGCVWRARHLELDLPVAIKLVHPDIGGDWLPERLFREARAAASLGHPAIVRVLDFGRSPEGLPFLAMEFLRGESLANHLLRVGRMAPAEALRLLLPIADGLVLAHADKIVHRDVKPDNIFVALNGERVQPKLLDFGLVRWDGASSTSCRLTAAGVVLGTPLYLSPEQASGLGTIDQRVDVWSFCATLYECLTGALPFQGTSWSELRRQILEDDPKPISEFGVDDAELWQLLKKGLAKSPGQRWSSMHALGQALAGWLLERGVTSDLAGVALDARWAPPASRRAEETALQSTLAVVPPVRPGRTGAGEPSSAASRQVAEGSGAPMERAVAPDYRGRRRLLLGAAAAVALSGIGMVISATPAWQFSGAAREVSSNPNVTAVTSPEPPAPSEAAPDALSIPAAGQLPTPAGPEPEVAPVRGPSRAQPARPAEQRPRAPRVAGRGHTAASAGRPDTGKITRVRPLAAPSIETTVPQQQRDGRHQHNDPMDLMVPY